MDKWVRNGRNASASDPPHQPGEDREIEIRNEKGVAKGEKLHASPGHEGFGQQGRRHTAEQPLIDGVQRRVSTPGNCNEDRVTQRAVEAEHQRDDRAGAHPGYPGFIAAPRHPSGQHEVSEQHRQVSFRPVLDGHAAEA